MPERAYIYIYIYVPHLRREMFEHLLEVVAIQDTIDDAWNETFQTKQAAPAAGNSYTMCPFLLWIDERKLAIAQPTCSRRKGRIYAHHSGRVLISTR
jgi:hypothetical protein